MKFYKTALIAQLALLGAANGKQCHQAEMLTSKSILKVPADQGFYKISEDGH